MAEAAAVTSGPHDPHAGSHALLVTDLVDSTALAARLGHEAVADLFAEHDRLARDVLAAHDGREIDKSDGFLLLFDSVGGAVGFALAYHRAIATLHPPLSARAGIHLGPVTLTLNTKTDIQRGAKLLEVEGLTKAIAARVMAMATGGQLLLSAAARDALGDTPLRVVAHGHWRLKGLTEPLEVFEVGDESAPFVPPADGPKAYRVVRSGDHWLPVAEVRHTLPAERDAFVGRRADQLALARSFEGGARLVTLVGAAGVGKTRLATHFGWTWLGDWPGGAWFCDLTEARDLGAVTSAVAVGLGVPLGPADPLHQLGHAIAARGRCLVLLDNFEQVAHLGAETVGAWLDRAPDARFVVTSRAVLGLPGETTLELPPLNGPDAEALFAARARQAGVALSEADVVDAAALVEVLDRLPLAIELAAARVRVMAPEALLARMGDRFKLLAAPGARRGRQATLRAALDWSWELLAPDEQVALAQLSVFEGGFTLGAAEAVVSLDSTWTVDAVQALVDKSLVRRSVDPFGAVRFHLLLAVREYAAERLAALDPLPIERRHGAHFAAAGSEAALRDLQRPGARAARRALELDLGNLVAASRRAIRRADGAVAAGAARAAWAIFSLRGPFAVGLELLASARAVVEDHAHEAPDVDLDAGNALRLMGRADEAQVHYERALAAYTHAGRPRGEGFALANLGALERSRGRLDAAHGILEASFARQREARDPDGEARALAGLGLIEALRGRHEAARAHSEAALALYRAIGDENGEGIVLGNLGTLAADSGRPEEARGLLEQALALHRACGDRFGEGKELGNLAVVCARQGDLRHARELFDQARSVHRELGSRREEGIALGNLGEVHRELGLLEEARGYFEASLAVADEVGDALSREHDALQLAEVLRLLVEG